MARSRPRRRSRKGARGFPRAVLPTDPRPSLVCCTFFFLSLSFIPKARIYLPWRRRGDFGPMERGGTRGSSHEWDMLKEFITYLPTCYPPLSESTVGRGAVVLAIMSEDHGIGIFVTRALNGDTSGESRGEIRSALGRLPGI